jgi:phosphoribosylformimino-5-aminoimidazole carboxamide ribotide isomerase
MTVLVPSIDLLDGRVVRLRQGRFDDVTVFDVDPIAYARALAGKVERLHVVDLEGSRSGAPTQLATIAAIAQTFGPGVQVGGGVRTRADVERLASLGVDRFVMGTTAIERPEVVEEIARAYPDRVVLAVDARDGFVAVAGWTSTTSATPLDVAARFSALPLDALLFTDVHRDGTHEGPAVDATGALAIASQRRVIASGGVGALDHLRAIAARREIFGVVVGRALFEGRFEVDAALAALAGA